jgi:hypothetical protein
MVHAGCLLFSNLYDELFRGRTLIAIAGLLQSSSEDEESAPLHIRATIAPPDKQFGLHHIQ